MKELHTIYTVQHINYYIRKYVSYVVRLVKGLSAYP